MLPDAASAASAATAAGSSGQRAGFVVENPR